MKQSLLRLGLNKLLRFPFGTLVGLTHNECTELKTIILNYNFDVISCWKWCCCRQWGLNIPWYQKFISCCPVSLANILCKLTERLIRNRLLFVSDEIKIISERQGSFRRCRSTIEKLIFLFQEVQDDFQRK